MSISVKTRKMLWGKAASRCAMPECRQELVMDETETDDPSIIGEECHIIAKGNNGPRGNSEFPEEKRDLYNNLILLCNNHHKMIDDQEEYYTVEKIKRIKENHEEWVKDSLTIDKVRIKDEIVYSDYIDEWVERADLTNWEAWTSWLLGSGQPSIKKQRMYELEDLSEWLFTRVYPGSIIELENSFENFRRVLRDLINSIQKYPAEKGEMIYTEKIYKIDHWNPELNDRLHKEYLFHVDLIMDLTLELTRAANYICDQVRKYIISNFRLEEGSLIVTAGPFMDLTFKRYKVSYIGNERTGIPYQNLEKFKKDRETRDINFGIGRNVEETLEMDEDYY